MALKFTVVRILNDIVFRSREELAREMYIALPNVVPDVFLAEMPQSGLSSTVKYTTGGISL